MSNVSLQRKTSNFQENPSDLDAQLLELGFLSEKDDAMQMIFYTGKEKDEESSLYYCEQRYYAAHISRWVSTGPTWLEDGINLYAYVHGNPVSGVDPSGTETVENDDKKTVEHDNQSGHFSKVRKNGEEDDFKEKDRIDCMRNVPEETKQRLREFRDAMESNNLLEENGLLEQLIKKMASHHLSMNPKLELTTIGVTLDEVYVGFQRKGNKSHTMGKQFTEILEKRKKENANNDNWTIIVHLHPFRENEDRVPNRATMFSKGDQANMSERQIWIGLEIYPEKDDSYSVDVYASIANIFYEDKTTYSNFNNLYNRTKKNWVIPAVYLKTIDGIKARKGNFKEYRMKEK